VIQIIGTQSLGRAIKAIRSQRGLKQKELAEMVGISQSHLSLLENGHPRCKPTLDELSRIADALNIRSSELLLEAELIADPEAHRKLRDLSRILSKLDLDALKEAIHSKVLSGPEDEVGQVSTAGPLMSSARHQQGT